MENSSSQGNNQSVSNNSKYTLQRDNYSKQEQTETKNIVPPVTPKKTKK